MVCTELLLHVTSRVVQKNYTAVVGLAGRNTFSISLQLKLSRVYKMVTTKIQCQKYNRISLNVFTQYVIYKCDCNLTTQMITMCVLRLLNDYLLNKLKLYCPLCLSVCFHVIYFIGKSSRNQKEMSLIISQKQTMCLLIVYFPL